MEQPQVAAQHQDLVAAARARVDLLEAAREVRVQGAIACQAPSIALDFAARIPHESSA
jgi:hypothetical protein